MEEKKWQLKCKKCGNVTHTQGILTQSDRICDNCHEVITESGIAEVKQDLLLE